MMLSELATRPLTPIDWVFVALASAIIFGIHIKKLSRDIQGWMKKDG